MRPVLKQDVGRLHDDVVGFGDQWRLRRVDAHLCAGDRRLRAVTVELHLEQPAVAARHALFECRQLDGRKAGRMGLESWLKSESLRLGRLLAEAAFTAGMGHSGTSWESRMHNRRKRSLSRGAPYDRWPTGGAGYESGVEDGKREAEAMMRKRYSPHR